MLEKRVHFLARRDPGTSMDEPEVGPQVPMLQLGIQSSARAGKNRLCLKARLAPIGMVEIEGGTAKTGGTGQPDAGVVTHGMPSAGRDQPVEGSTKSCAPLEGGGPESVQGLHLNPAATTAQAIHRRERRSIHADLNDVGYGKAAGIETPEIRVFHHHTIDEQPNRAWTGPSKVKPHLTSAAEPDPPMRQQLERVCQSLCATSQQLGTADAPRGGGAIPFATDDGLAGSCNRCGRVLCGAWRCDAGVC